MSAVESPVAGSDGAADSGVVDVLVVGAGPTGLLLASELVRRGVVCRLVDAHDAPLDWDRATVVHPRSLEIFEKLGLVDRFLAEGVAQRMARVHSGGQVLGQIELAGCGSRYGFNLGISEQVTEALLTEHLQACGGTVDRSTSLVDLHDRIDHVEATLERGGLRETVAARFVVGCDGLHSAVRRLSGIELQGHDIPDPWAVFDTTITGWGEPYEANYVILDAPPVILTALPGRRWRVYARPASENADVVADAQQTVRSYHPGVAFDGVTDVVRFHCHTKVAERYREGRRLIAGDAAHVCSPAEGHGMNSGMQDAFNLGWKLALVASGAAPLAILDSYGAERHPVAEIITRSGDATDASQLLARAAERAERDAALRATLSDPEASHHEAIAEAELDVDYAGSPIVLGARLQGLWPGQRLDPLVPVESPDGAGRLVDLAPAEAHTVLVLGGPDATEDDLADLESGLGEAVSPGLFGGLRVVTSGAPRGRAWSRLEPDAAHRLGVAGVVTVVVRPDGHVGLVADRDHAEAVLAYERQVAPGSS